MVGYDFDKTIYKGDCSVDFFFYMIFSRPYLLIFSPWFLIVFLLYAVKLLSKKKFKEFSFFFVVWFKNIDRIVDKFWSKNAKKILDWYAFQRKDDDIIISAALSFIIKPALDMLNVKNYIVTNFSITSGKIIGENCYGQAKRNEFERIYPKKKLEAFYSDSLSDMPMMEISKEAFIVKNGEIKKLEK